MQVIYVEQNTGNVSKMVRRGFNLKIHLWRPAMLSVRCKWLILTVVCLLAGCTGVPNKVYQKAGQENSGPALTLWMLSDIQPKNIEARRDFEQAVEDVNNYVENVDLAVIAGDILKSRSQENDFEWLLSVRSKSKVKHWFEIAGNHDVRSKEIFDRYFTKPSYYGVEVGNVLLLLLSDESVDSMTTISDEAFVWWRDMVKNNQDRILLTVSHAYLQKSGLFGSSLKSRQIDGSSRFEEVLREQRVALWGSGHSHLPQGLAGTINSRKDLGGTCFVNVSSIDTNRFLDSQSRLFIFNQGSDIVWIRSRNHTKKMFEPSLDYPIKLEKPFVWDGSEPRIILPGQ